MYNNPHESAESDKIGGMNKDRDDLSLVYSTSPKHFDPTELVGDSNGALCCSAMLSDHL